MTQEEAVEVILRQEPWVPCPALGVPISRALREALSIIGPTLDVPIPIVLHEAFPVTGLDQCNYCGGISMHGRVPNPRFEEACRLLEVKTPRERDDDEMIEIRKRIYSGLGLPDHYYTKP